jgi:hypothetical protein
MALQRLERSDEAADLFSRIHDYAVDLVKSQPRIDYFATSLPAMLLFNEYLALRNRINSLFLRAQAVAGLKRTTEAQSLLQEVLALDASHAGAADLLRESALTSGRNKAGIQ